MHVIKQLLIILFGIFLLTNISGVTMTSFNLSQLSYGQSNNINNNTIISTTHNTANPGPRISTNNRNLEINLLAESLQNRLNKSVAILEVTSKLPQVMNFSSYSISFNPSLHGIPKDVDLQKRQVAQNILDTDKDIQIIFVNMPNGNFYLEEPYSRQINLTTNNIASNGFFKGAIDTHDTYLSGVFISNSSGLKEASITVPIYSIKNNNNNNNETLIGTWAGALNLTLFNKSLQSLNLTDNNKRIVYVDQYGQKIADSNKQLSDKVESFASLLSFKNAVMGKSGSDIENINGTKLLVSYHPVKVHTTNWAVLLMES